ncbi:MAG: hypothetical protein QOI38_734 [Sphingomonadales bacterium]|jgi:hypothetical protein|nr:hypothetical protein [Sphingomonadales bacterium]
MIVNASYYVALFLLPAVVAALLPRPLRLAATALGAVSLLAFLFVVQPGFGPAAQIGRLIAIAVLIGGIAGEGYEFLRGRSAKRGWLHG